MNDSQFYIQWNRSVPSKAKHRKMPPCSVNIMTKYYYVLKLLITPSSGIPIHQLYSNYTTFFWSYRLHFSGILDLQLTWYTDTCHEKNYDICFDLLKMPKMLLSSVLHHQLMDHNGFHLLLKRTVASSISKYDATIMKAQADAWHRFVATEISMVSIENPHSDSFYAKLNHSICLKPFLCSIKLRPLNLEPKSDQWMICHETWHKIPSFRMQLCTFAEISLKSHVISVNKKKIIACFNAPLWVHFVKWSEDLFSKKTPNNGIKIQCGRKV